MYSRFVGVFFTPTYVLDMLNLFSLGASCIFYHVYVDLHIIKLQWREEERLEVRCRVNLILGPSVF